MDSWRSFQNQELTAESLIRKTKDSPFPVFCVFEESMEAMKHPILIGNICLSTFE